ncbi:hypothetical protein CIW51_09165 [Mycolicibacterium sp. P9-22]|nr:hypothetical protein [Mycolicibacterium sp. P9-22]KAA0118613.1 hypothetical protein CIW51_09165 [Mycolicibacterium sp. P9-22]
MTPMRILLALAGVGLVGYGALLVLDNPPVIILRILMWAVVAAVVHDFVFAPLCAAIGMAGRRLIPLTWQSPVAVAGLCSVVLVLLAIPVFSRPGMRPDNPSVLDRDYPLGLTVALAVVWFCVPVYLLLRRLPIRQNQVVDGQGADDVERQPPSV